MKTAKLLLLFGFFFVLPTFGQGTVNSGPQYSVPIYPSAGSATVVGPSNISTDSTLNNLFIPGTTWIAGPNPYIDTASFHMRAVASSFQAVGACTAGSPNVSFSSGFYTNFQPGDGLVLYGCGATNALSTPSAPTVTPSVESGPDVANDVKNGPGGTTSYSYEIVARDKNGGLTPASQPGSTTTGPATLGTVTTSVSGLTRSNNTVTVTTTTANGAAVGGIVFVTNSTDATFSGFFVVASAPSSTQFTYNQGMDTRAGASTSATGGTVTTYQGNHLSWAAVPNAWQYYIYGRTAGSLTLVHVSRPGETQWTDYGATMSAAPTVPDFVPSTPPSVATNDYLATTISAGAGTAAITLATNATNSASGATVKFDDGPTLLAAYNALSTGTVQKGTLHISAPAFGTQYFINSHTDLSAFGAAITILDSGQITLNETLEVTGKTNWTGEMSGPGGTYSQFAWNSGMPIVVNSAYPGIAASAQSNYRFLVFNGNAQGLLMTVQAGGQFHFTVENSVFFVNQTDYIGQAIVLYGISQSSFKGDTFLVGSQPSSPPYGYSLSAAVLNKNDVSNSFPPGISTFEHCFFENRGFGISSNPSLNNSIAYSFSDMYSQALRSPLVMFGAIGGAGSNFTFDRFNNDTSITAVFANWNVNATVTIKNILDNGAETSGASPGIVTGNLIPGLTAENTGSSIGQNREMFRSHQNQNLTLPVYGATDVADYSMRAALHFPSQHTLFWDLKAPMGVAVAGPTTGGALPLATWTFEVSANGADGGETALSAPSGTCVVTTTGTQTCMVSWSAVPGAVSYNVYETNSGGTVGVAACQAIVALSCPAAAMFGGGHTAPTDTGTGTTTIMSNQIISPQLLLTGPLSGNVSFTGTLKGSFTANRTDTLPDASGTVSLAADYSCGATSACSPTAVVGARTFYGDAHLVTGSPSTVTVTGFSPAFTSTSTFECTANDNTSQSALKVSKASTSSITITGPNTVTDDVSYICKGS
jgi:hypothetical protein